MVVVLVEEVRGRRQRERQRIRGMVFMFVRCLCVQINGVFWVGLGY